MKLYAIVAILVLLFAIVFDIKAVILYKKADVTMGEIVRCDGSMLTKFYGRYQYRRYWKYLIRCNTSDGVFEDVVPMKQSDLKIGDMVEVRYLKNEHGIRLLDDISVKRFREFSIALVLGVILSLLIIFWIESGAIVA